MGNTRSGTTFASKQRYQAAQLSQIITKIELRTRSAHTTVAILVLLLMGLQWPTAGYAQFTYATNKGAITITGYTGPGGAVIIPTTVSNMPVTTIGDGAFSHCTRVAFMSIPHSVTNIGENAFGGCAFLTAVNLPTNLLSIGSYCFSDCASLTNISLPSSLRSFGAAAFQSCSNLATAKVPDSIVQLPSWAFCFCERLTTVTMPASLRVIGAQAFRGCLSLATFDIPGTVTNIIDSAFLDCRSLTNITIPAGVISIGGGAFTRCGLTSIDIPETVASIGMQAFVGSNLLQINVAPSNPVYTSIDGVLFDKSASTLLQYPRAKKEPTYRIPNTVTTIGPWAFDGSFQLVRLVIPPITINIHAYAFAGCSHLMAAFFQGSSPNADNSIFYGTQIVKVYYTQGTFGWGAFFAGRPAIEWNPQTSAPMISANGFEFTTIGQSNLVMVVEFCTNLHNAGWSPLTTIILQGGSWTFLESRWTNHPTRFYRLRLP